MERWGAAGCCGIKAGAPRWHCPHAQRHLLGSQGRIRPGLLPRAAGRRDPTRRFEDRGIASPNAPGCKTLWARAQGSIGRNPRRYTFIHIYTCETGVRGGGCRPPARSPGWRCFRAHGRDCLRQVNGLRVAVMPRVFSVNRGGKMRCLERYWKVQDR